MAKTDLVRCVAYTDVEIGELCLDNISQRNLEPLLLRLALHPFCEFGGHSRIKLDGYDFLRLFQYFHCQVTSSRTDLKDNLKKKIKIFFLINQYSFPGA